MSDKPAQSIHTGDILAEKYRVERILGQGGMGVVVLAEHIELRERVAIKFLLDAPADNPELAFSTAVGGIAAQTTEIAVADMGAASGARRHHARRRGH